MEERRRELLGLLARRCGVVEGYHDIWGVFHPAEPETEGEILRAMGVRVDEVADLEAELSQREEEAASRLCEPFTLIDQGKPQRIALGPAPAQAALLLADQRLELLPVDGEAPAGHGLFEPSAPLPAGLHEAEVAAGSGSGSRTLVAVCPRRGHQPERLDLGARLWGVNLPLYGLRSERNWGVGDFADLLEAVDWAAGLGADLVGLLPLHALFNEAPYGVSPYFPSSRLFLNPLHIAVDRVPEAAAPEVKAYLARPETRRELERLRTTDLVDHAAVWALKAEALRLCHRAFATRHREGTERGEAFRSWRRAQGQALEEFAAFSALRERHAAEGTWRQWPEGLRSPRAPEVATFRRDHAEEVELHAWLQWVAETQLESASRRAREAGMAVGLYLDLALGVDPCGADAWVYQDVLALGASAGAPPDPFSLLGQRWGVPPAVPERHRQSGYLFFRDTLRRSARRCGALRIDHVLALWRLYWIPGDLPASRGAYVAERSEELLGLLRLVSQEERCLVVGEDLGTIPPEVREGLMASGFCSYRLLLFEKDDAGRFRRPGDLPRQALVSFATHDLPTLDGFWQGSDIEVKRALGRYPTPEAEEGDVAGRRQDRQRLLEALQEQGLLPEGAAPGPEVPADRWEDLAVAVHAYLARAPSALLLANLDDLLGGTEMQNLPGTLDEHPNWRRRRSEPIAAWSSSRRARRIAGAIRAQGRGPLG